MIICLLFIGLVLAIVDYIMHTVSQIRLPVLFVRHC